MPNESNNSTAVNALDGLLREAVEQACSRDVPRDRLKGCLDRVIGLAPSDLPSDDRQAVSSQPSTHVWRPAHRSRWMGLAATASVVTAMVLIQCRSMSVSLADVAQAVSRRAWIHVTQRTAVGETESGETEAWYSTTSDVSATRRKEWIAYYDHELKIYYSYDLAERVLYRVPEIGRARRQSHLAEITETLPLLLGDNGAPDDPLSKMEFLKSHRNDLTLVNQKVEKVIAGGREWLDYTLTVEMRDEQQPIQVLFRVDPDTKLPHLNRVTGHHNGQACSYEATYDYPEVGPQDIYAIGVPRDAQLVDRVPTNDVARLIAGVEASRVRFDDFRAVVVSYHDGYKYWWHELPEVIHRKGNRMRRDLAYTRESRAVEPAEDFEVSEWWRRRAGDFKYSPTRICIGGTDHSFTHRSSTEPDGKVRKEIVSVRSNESGLNMAQWVPAFWSLTPDYVARPPLGVPNQHMEAVADTSPSSGPEGTVMLRVRRSGRVDSAPDPDADQRPPQPDEFRFWIDPAREYVVLRTDMMGDGENVMSSYIVETLAQSPKGHWYPTRVRRTSSGSDVEDQILEFHVEFDVDIPDALFEVKQPLPVEDVLRRTSQ